VLTGDDRADRLHAAISTTFEGFFSAADGASFERRTGHARLLFPRLPIRLFNGVIVESDTCSGVAESIREVEELGLPCGLQVRDERHPGVEEDAARLGLTERDTMPGMTVTPDELRDTNVADLEIVRVSGEAGLVDAARLVTEGFATRTDFWQPLYAPAILELAGMAVYLGRVNGTFVTTAIGYRTGRDVAIFSVATPPQHRRRGYGAAITAHTCREGFADGADLAWLQTSPMGESVYRALGFRHTVTHLMLGRPRSRD
jgi:ribosomal protein S18 acetylase RimI-like enzyme